MRDDSYREMLEQDKIETFDYILDAYMEEDEGYQRKASRIMEIVRDYLLRRMAK